MSVAYNNSQVEPVVDECGCFTLYSSHTESQTVDRLMRLCQENYPTEIDFDIQDIQWTERIASETIHAFQHYADSALRWNDGFFRDSNQESEHFFRVVEAAGKLKLFRQLIFGNRMTTLERPMVNNHDLIPRFAAVLATVIREGRLEKIAITNFEISANAMAVLATGLATAGQTDGLSELRFSHCRFIGRTESGGIMGASEYLAAGLASNTTLKQVGLSKAQLNDASLAGIVGALSSHPSLEVLEIDHCEFGRNTMQNIHRWLRWEGCRVKELRIDGGYYVSDDQSDDNLNIVHLFAQDLPQNSSLESLSISRHSDIDGNGISLLLGNLWRLPNLRSLKVVAGNMTAVDFVSLAGNIVDTMPAAHRLRSLDLSQNPMIVTALRRAMQDDNDRAQSTILQLLEDVFPEVGYLGKDFERAIQTGILPSRVGLALDRNRCIGLLQRGATIPLSAWPLVMAKANKDRFLAKGPSRKATILYEMLQGPAFPL